MSEEIEGTESAEEVESEGETTESEGVQQDPGSESEGEGTAPAQGQQAPAPQYLSHDDARHMFTQWQNHYTQQMNRMMQQVLQNQRQPAAQPEPEKPLYPDQYHETEQWAPQDWYKAMRESDTKHAQNYQALEKRFNEYVRRMETQERANQMAGWLNSETERAASQLPAFKDAKGNLDQASLAYLKNTIDATVRQSGGIRNVNIPQIAKALNDHIMGRVNHHVSRKLKAPNQPGKAPAPRKGSGTKASQEKPENIDDAHAGFRKYMKRLGEQDS